MIEMQGNSLLYSLRKRHRYSLWKVSKESKVNIFALFNMERGYWRISEKSAKKLGAYYGVEPESLSNKGEIPSSIKIRDRDSARFFAFVKSFFMNKITLIVSLLVTIIGAIIAPISGVKLLDMDDNYLSYYNERYVGIYNQVADYANAGDSSASIGTMPLFYVVNGVHTNDFFYYAGLDEATASYSYPLSYSDYDEEGEETNSWINKIYEFFNKEHLGFSIVDIMNLYTGDSASSFMNGKISIRFNRDESGGNIHFFESESVNASFSSRLRLSADEGHYNVEFNILYSDKSQYILYGAFDLLSPLKVYNVVSFSMDSLMLSYAPLKESDPMVKEVGDTLSSLLNKAMDDFSALLSKLGYEEGVSSFMESYLADEKTTKGRWVLLTVLFSLSSLLGALALCSFFIGLILILSNKDPEVEKASPIEKEEDKEKHRKLPKNWAFGPCIKEGYYRIAGLALVLTGNLLAPILCGNLFSSFDSSLDLTKIVDTLSLYPFQLFGSFVLITVIMNILTKGKNLPFKASAFMAGGLIYYVLELVIEAQLLRKSAVLATAVDYLPGNLFWSVGIFAFISLFLFHTPKGCDSKKKEVAYRCCSLIPVGYIAISVALLYLRKTHQIALPLFVKDLLLQKSNLLLLYGVLFLYGVYFLRLFLKRRYGYEEAKRFENSSEYAFYQNAVMLLAMALPILLDVFCSDLSFFIALGFNHNQYLWILLPMFAFYRPRIPERDGFLDALYVVGITLVWFIPYLIAFIMFSNWLPF